VWRFLSQSASKVFSTPVLRGFDSKYANKVLNHRYLNLNNFGRQRRGNDSFGNQQLQLKTNPNNRTSGSLVKPPEEEVKPFKVPLMAWSQASTES